MISFTVQRVFGEGNSVVDSLVMLPEFELIFFTSELSKMALEEFMLDCVGLPKFRNK